MFYRRRTSELHGVGALPSNAAGNTWNAKPRWTGRSSLASVSVTLLAAGCTSTIDTAPRDVGNMAYSEPLLQGNLSITAVTGRQTRDTGNMAYLYPQPAGNIGATDVH